MFNSWYVALIISAIVLVFIVPLLLYTRYNSQGREIFGTYDSQIENLKIKIKTLKQKIKNSQKEIEFLNSSSSLNREKKAKQLLKQRKLLENFRRELRNKLEKETKIKNILAKMEKNKTLR